MPEQVAEYLKQGFLLFQAPTDMDFMAAGAKSYLDPLQGPRSG
jgi:hypothetical protein